MLFGADSDGEVETGSPVAPKSQVWQGSAARPHPHNPAWKLDDVIANRGPTRKVSLMSQTKDGTTPAIFVPQVALYLHRGDQLSLLNFYEYLGCILFHNESNPCVEVHNLGTAQGFPMDPNFEGHLDCHHSLSLNQATPLLSGPVPRHPGKKPDQSRGKNALSAWKERADKYARYYLLLFWPEVASDQLGYTWEDLLMFIEDLQKDASFLSTSRLMIMDNHMQGMRISKVHDKIIKHYHSLTQQRWTDSERQEFMHLHGLGRKVRTKVPSVTELMDDAKGSDLRDRELRELEKQISHDSKQKAMFASLLKTNDACSGSWPNKLKASDCISTVPLETIQNSAAALLSFKDCSVPDSLNSEEKKNHSCSVKTHTDQLVHELEARDKDAASQQVELLRTFAEHFCTEGSTAPKLTLVHGAPGVGKSAIRNVIMKASAFSGRFNLKTAFNAINATEMGGTTTATLIYTQGGYNDIGIGNNFRPEVIAELKNNGLTVNSVVFVEEVSTQAPAHIVQLSKLLKDITSVTSSDFGGCHVFSLEISLRLDLSGQDWQSQGLCLTFTPPKM